MDSLKAEIEAAQKQRDELMKWKLIVVATVGATALGLANGSPVPNAHLALVVIPFACSYIDLMCRNLSMRSKLISAFLAQDTITQTSGPNERYEQFYQQFQKVWGGRSLETFALLWSTVLLSLAIIPVGIALSSANLGTPASWAVFQWPNILFYASGLTGLLLSFLIHRSYTWRRKRIDADAKVFYEKITSRRNNQST